ncbi:MAG: multifunctional oxoglutarate decarboxylase/oxoglutarate dehydrogenase thiamine pyrophosphate-binding subunit/dihydrolipoyllysine-residue succinyltransferase subunit [Planctomycetes bacterium]|nr:multifunctional oxoglutarate decarboxylase/oxoglutarate dehydrogenase thiamine pyrophosphate-binding subunit/dihydrolipoyllysine-residue succinyltransferase subunit [Planctomycetota bacterium]
MTDSRPNNNPRREVGLSGLGAAFFEAVYDDFKNNPASVDGGWLRFFEQLSPEARSKLEAEIMARQAAAAVGDAGDESDAGAQTTVAPTVMSHDAVPQIVTSPIPHADAPAETKHREPDAGFRLEPLRGVASKIVENMESSLDMPTATTFRNIPVRALEENRSLLNQVLESRGKSKITYTHVIGFALVRALAKHPALNTAYENQAGAPHRRVPTSINFGVAIDLPKQGGGRSLVVPSIKKAGELSFIQFAAAVDDLIARARAGKLAPADFKDTTITFTNPGTLGTIASVPRLMKGQGAIVATGAIEYSAEAQAMSAEARVALGIGKMMGITSTYDHRVIQGAESGAYLAEVHALLEGKHEFYESIFKELRVPFYPYHQEPDTKKPASALDSNKDALERAAKMQQLIDAHRTHGHRLADLDPLELESPAGHSELQLQHFGFTVWDLDREFYIGMDTGKPAQQLLHDTYFVYSPTAFGSLRVALARLRHVYCRKIGYEVEHLANAQERVWLRDRIETMPVESASVDEKLQILRKLIEADAFEKFLHSRYVGQKRFSLEGGDSLIPLLNIILQRAHRTGVREVILGMAHRGRLNVLANLVGMPLERIFAEFEGVAGAGGGYSGDVKYHLGFRGQFAADGNAKLPVSLACNPSHLEAVNPVVVGIARAKQDIRGDRERTTVLPVLIHGDAAFAGQGVVMETLQFARLDGYKTGGTYHVIINNQIGYTANPRDSRSSLYCSDLAKTIEAPIFHVNGDDALAVAHVAKLAFDYMREFRHDVVIDLICYRRHGHNEGDEPGYTQPVMVQKIERHPPVWAFFERQLAREKLIDENYSKNYESEYITKLAAARDAVRDRQWAPGAEILNVTPDIPQTSVPAETLARIGLAASSWPADFTPHQKIERSFRKRRQMLESGGAQVDFGLAETLAYGTLLAGGVTVRLTGEDSGRGTFSHRHSVLYDYKNGNRYIPLNNLGAPGHALPGQAIYEITDSLLSEEAALGFEYGYSVERHRADRNENILVIWEAQFGDFVNGAQIQIDQFIASGEAKWGEPCGLVLFLPHGYDGQGPEHSSARLERFLQLCARDNMRVVNATTAAQMFHLLRDQVYRRPVKPLILMTPKSLLRAPEACSPIAEFEQGRFEPILDDSTIADPAACGLALLCSGKLYYDLAAERERLGRRDVAILRFEQLYPLDSGDVARRLLQFPNAELRWVQEEGATMGAASFIRPRIEAAAGRAVTVISRPENASPAVGSARVHAAEQRDVIARAFGQVS